MKNIGKETQRQRWKGGMERHAKSRQANSSLNKMNYKERQGKNRVRQGEARTGISQAGQC